MSKLATLLRRISRAEPAPMGFATLSGRTKNPEMLVGVIVAKLDQAAAKAAAKAGAAFLLLEDGDLERDEAKIKAITAATEMPCGLRVSKPSSNAGASAQALGLDYLRLEDDDAPAAALLEDEMGYALSVPADTGDTLLRLLESMPFEALFAGSIEQPFTIRQQLELRRISGFARKPLILTTSGSLTSQDLECLRDSGVAALLLDGADVATRLSALRTEIDAMRPRRRRRDERTNTAVLPSVAHGGDDEDDED